MKKIISFIVCLSMILSILIIPTYASSTEENTVELISVNGPILKTRSTIEFVEGQTLELGYEFVYYENGEYVYEVEYITTVMEYIDIPRSTVRVEAYHKLDNFSNKATNALDASMNSKFPLANYILSADITYYCH